MSFDKERHHRHSTRLRGYDYTQNGGYFVTICTAQRECLFGQITSEGEFVQNPIGAIVEECWTAIPNHFPSVELDTFLVMPNHIHGILMLFGDASKNPIVRFGKPAKGSLGMIIGSFKAAVSRKINALHTSESTFLWQRNYHDEIIRNEKMLNAIRIYIDNNPTNWAFDSDNPIKKPL
jgi:REP element-mobilizing transposase RayT